MRREMCKFSVTGFGLFISLANHLILTVDMQLSKLTKSVKFYTSSQCFVYYLIMINYFFDYHPAPLIYTQFSF